MTRRALNLAALTIFSALALTACATWSTNSVSQTAVQKQIVTQKTQAKDIIVTEKDITNRPYVSLGDITVNVNKTTIFNKTPTKEQVNQRLQEKAAELGADAVVFVRYGEAGVSAFSWGSLEGKGRAVKFKK